MSLTVEVDAKYIKGMLNNPDIQPNAAMNRWIAGILMFDFTLKHVPGSKHQGPDGLSRRQCAPEDDKEDEETSDDVEEWLDELLSCALWVAKDLDEGYLEVMSRATVLHIAETTHTSDLDIPANDASRARDDELLNIKAYLESFQLPSSISQAQRNRILKQAPQFFVRGSRLWRKDMAGRHQIVLFGQDCVRTLRETHDRLGHKGFYSTRRTMADRFWWPTLDKDLTWYL
jgi:hypothetical protein